MNLPKGPYLNFEAPVVELAQSIEDLIKDSNVTSSDVKDLVAKKEKLLQKIQKKLTPWNRVELARRAGRPNTSDYIANLFSDFIEIHGDRYYGDDPAIVTGLGKFQGQKVMVVGNRKGKDTRESIQRNFGMAHPEGYRKAARAFRMAQKFHLPVISFIDTPGAYPGIGAEERGQASAIAENLKLMALLEVPIICIIIGEGASGGALGIGVGDRFLMLENAWYCVISPEGCAAILWDDSAKKQELSSVMKLTANDLKELKVVDQIIPEPLGGAHWDPEAMYVNMKEAIAGQLGELGAKPIQDILEERMEKLVKIGTPATK